MSEPGIDFRAILRLLFEAGVRYNVIDAQTLRNATNLTLETDLGDFDRPKERDHILQLEALERLTEQGDTGPLP